MSAPAKTRVPALVYPSETGSGFGIIRCLDGQDIFITGLNGRKAFTRFSRRFKSLLCPSPESDGDGETFIEFLLRWGEKNGPAALFIADDLASFLVSKNQARLKKFFYYPYQSDKAVLGGLDKWMMYETARQCAIPVPESILARKPEDLSQLGPEFHWPLVIKPVVSRFVIDGDSATNAYAFRKIFGYARAVRASNRAELERLTAKIFPESIEILIQEEVPGNCDRLYTYNFYVNKKNEISPGSCHRKIRQVPADFGITSVGDCVEAGVMENYTRDFVRAIDFHGMGSIEFKKDAVTGEYKLIEINPRPPHSILHATSSGCNFILAQYLDLVEGRALALTPKPGRELWFHLEGDLQYLASNCWDKKSPYYVSFFQWFGIFTGKPVVEAFLSRRDWLMNAVYVWRSLSRFLRKFVQNLILHWTGFKVSHKGMQKAKNAS